MIFIFILFIFPRIYWYTDIRESKSHKHFILHTLFFMQKATTHACIVDIKQTLRKKKTRFIYFILFLRKNKKICLSLSLTQHTQSIEAMHLFPPLALSVMHKVHISAVLPLFLVLFPSRLLKRFFYAQ